MKTPASTAQACHGWISIFVQTLFVLLLLMLEAEAYASADFGDAPSSYGTPNHTIVNNLMIGTSIDADGASQPGTNANGDDTNGSDDEDGLLTPPLIPTTSGQAYTLSSRVTNTTGTTAYLTAYVDFNKDGDFNDTGEKSTTQTIYYSGYFYPSFTVPAGVSAGTTYARLRLSQTLVEAESPIASASSGEVEDYTVTIASSPYYDYGDAPSSYGIARHTINNSIYLGSKKPDAETGSQNTYNASGDGVDEDGAPTQPGNTAVTLFPILKMTDTTYSVGIKATNTTGASGKLYGWIDFDHSGTFDTDEAASVSVPNGTSAGTITLTWGSVPLDVKLGTTIIRLRLTTDSSVTTSTPFSNASNGEVEDFPIAVAQAIPPDSSSVSIVKDDTPASCTSTVFSDNFDDLPTEQYFGANTSATPYVVRNWTAAGGGGDSYARTLSVSPFAATQGTSIYFGNGFVRRFYPAIGTGFTFDANGKLTTPIEAIELHDDIDDSTPGALGAGESDWGPYPVTFSRSFNTTAGQKYRLYFSALPEDPGGVYTSGIMRVDTPSGSIHFKAPGSNEGIQKYRVEFTATSATSTIKFVNYGHVGFSDGWCDPNAVMTSAWCTGSGGSSISGQSANELIIDDVVVAATSACLTEGHIAGFVYRDTNGNDTFDTSTEAGLANITVRVYDESLNTLVGTTSTLSDGSYGFTDLNSTKTYRIEVDTADNDLPFGTTIGTQNPLTAVGVTAGSTATGKNFGFDGGALASCAAPAPTGGAWDNSAVGWSHNAGDPAGQAANHKLASIQNAGVIASGANEASTGLSTGTADSSGYATTASIPATLAEAISTNKYYQYTFTTQSSLGGNNILYGIGLATMSTGIGSNHSGTYKVQIQVDDNAAFSSPEIVKNQIQIDENNPTTGADISDGPHDYGVAYYYNQYDFDKTVALLPNKTYYVRAYLYNDTLSGFIGSSSGRVIFDDLRLKSYTCATGNITGKVYIDSNGSDTYDAGSESGLGNIRVTLYNENFTPANTADDTFIAYTDTATTDGSYSFNGLDPNQTYRLVVDTADSDLPAGAAIGTDHPLTFVVVPVSGTITKDFGFDPVITDKDFGDAPATYGDASHYIVAGIHLGNYDPDSETASHYSFNARADLFDDGAPSQNAPGAYIPLFPVLQMTDNTYSASFKVTNTTGTAGKLYGWIDFDQSGTFEADEGTSVSVSTGSSNATATLNWASIPANIKLGTTFIRLRLTTDATVTTSTPTGLASNGEVEDYPIAVAMDIPPNSPSVSIVSGATPAACETVVFEDDFDDLSPHVYWGANRSDGQPIRDWVRSGGGADTYARTVDSSGLGYGTSIYFGNGAVRRVSPSISGGLNFDANGKLLTVLDAVALRDDIDDTSPGSTANSFGSESDWGPQPVTLSRTFATTVGKTYRLYFKAIPEDIGTNSFPKDGVMRLDVPGGSIHFKIPKSSGNIENYAVEFTAVSTSSTISFMNYGHFESGNTGYCDPNSIYNGNAWCTAGGDTDGQHANELIIDDVVLAEAGCPGAISGTVYTDNNGSNAFESGTDSGISSISVSLYDEKSTPANTADDTLLATTSSAADGTYSFSNLDDSLTYRIEVDEADTDLSGATIGTPNPLTMIVVTAGAITTGQDFGFDTAIYSNNYCVTPTGATGLLNLGDMSTSNISGIGSFTYADRVLPGYGTVDATVTQNSGVHVASTAAIDTGARQQSWLDENLPATGTAIYMGPGSGGTTTVTYDFDQPTGNVDLLILDVDEDDVVSITAKDTSGANITDFSGWRYRAGDLSVWANPDPVAMAPAWDSAAATLTSTEPGTNDHRSFGLLTPDVLVSQIVVSFTAPAVAGRHVYTILHTTDTGRDGETSCAVRDYGDAPATYGDAGHTISASIRLGDKAPDSESGSQYSFNATADGNQDDGAPFIKQSLWPTGNPYFPVLKETDTSYSIPVKVTNATGSTAKLIAWLDFDKSGTFEADEAASITVNTGTSGTTVTLNWASIPADIKIGTTFIRLRFSTDTSLTTSTPTGMATDGEVEDYRIPVYQHIPNDTLTVANNTTPPGCEAVVFSDNFDDLNDNFFWAIERSDDQPIRNWLRSGGGTTSYASTTWVDATHKTSVYFGNGSMLGIVPSFPSGFSFDSNGKLDTQITAVALRDIPDDLDIDVNSSHWGPEPVKLSRIFNTVPGKTYRLYFTALPEDKGTNKYVGGVMRVDAPGGSVHFKAPGSAESDQHYVIEFTATSASSTISFVNYGHMTGDGTSWSEWCDPTVNDWCTIGGIQGTTEANELIIDDVVVTEAGCASTSINGKVWFDADSDGIQNDGAGSYIEGASVELYDPATSTVIATQVTSSDGEYQFSNVDGLQASANYQLRIRKLDSQSPVSGWAITTLHAGSDTALDSDASLSGSYWIITLTSPATGVQTSGYGFGLTNTVATGCLGEDATGISNDSITNAHPNTYDFEFSSKQVVGFCSERTEGDPQAGDNYSVNASDRQGLTALQREKIARSYSALTDPDIVFGIATAFGSGKNQMRLDDLLHYMTWYYTYYNEDLNAMSAAHLDTNSNYTATQRVAMKALAGKVADRVNGANGETQYPVQDIFWLWNTTSNTRQDIVVPAIYAAGSSCTAIPSACTTSSNEKILVSKYFADQIVSFDWNNTTLLASNLASTTAGLTSYHDVTYDSTGRVFVLNNSGQILELDLSKTTTNKIIANYGTITGASGSTALVGDTAGYLYTQAIYAGKQSIVKFKPETPSIVALVADVSSITIGGYTGGDLAWSDGYLYWSVTASDNKIHIIKIDTSTGTTLSDQTLKKPDGINTFAGAIPLFNDAKGNLFIFDFNDFYKVNIATAVTTLITSNTLYGSNTPTGGASSLEFCASSIGSPAAAKDYGDAPASYGVPTHVVVSGIQLGVAIDADSTSLASTNADGDDNSGSDDEDGISTFPALTQGVTSYSIPAVNISVTNTTGSNATLYGFIDFNGDGDFADAGESASVTVANGASTPSAALSFTGFNAVPTTITKTFARFRLSTDTGLGSTTAANNGEVEDYALTITASAFPGSVCSITLDNSKELIFTGSNDGVLESGTMYAPGSTYRVSNISPGIDGIVTLNSRLSNSMSYLLDGNIGAQVSGTQEVMKFDMTLRLVNSGTSTTISTPVDLVLTSLDIDGDSGQPYSDGVVFYNADATFTNTGSKLQPTYYSDHVMYTTRIDARGYNDTTTVDPAYGAGAVYKDVTSVHYGGIVVNNTNSARSIMIFGSRTKFDQFTSLQCDPVEGGVIRGTVYTDIDKSDTYNAGDSTLPNISVSLYDNNGTTGNTADDTLLVTSPSESDGRYNFGGLNASRTYRVQVSTTDSDLPAGYTIGTTNPLDGVSVTAGGITANKNFGFDQPVSSCSLIVTTTADTDNAANNSGSLRDAIQCANATPGANTITFNMPTTEAGFINPAGVGNDYWSILLSSQLPSITEAVTIDGRTQTTNKGNTNTGAIAAATTVGIDNVALPAVEAPEVEITGPWFGAGLDIRSSNVSILGLGLRHFDTDIRMDQANTTNILLNGMTFGVDLATRTLPVGGTRSNQHIAVNASGVSFTLTNSLLAYAETKRGIVTGEYNNVSDVTANITGNHFIGNGLTGNTENGAIEILRTQNPKVSIIGNRFVGRGAGTATDLAIEFNDYGGGNAACVTCLVENNDISGFHDGVGYFTDASLTGLVINKNKIHDNTEFAVFLGNVQNATVSRNALYDNGKSGVLINKDTANGNIITQNSIYHNGEVGINLASTTEAVGGTTLNDANDADTGPNKLLNFPILSQVSIAGANLTVTGCAPAGSTVELFEADVSAGGAAIPGDNKFSLSTDYGEGQTYLVSFVEGDSAIDADSGGCTLTGVPDGNNQTGMKAFSVTLPMPAGLVENDLLTATATVAGTGTSEFSPVYTYSTACSLVVTVTADSDNATNNSGSLRDAIECANSTSTADTITFNIPTSQPGYGIDSNGDGYWSIKPTTPLPGITQPLVIDGSTQPGTTCPKPRVEINGSVAGLNADGIGVYASNSTIKGLIINNFSRNGILLSRFPINFPVSNTLQTNNSVECSYIGVDANGLVARPNMLGGIAVEGDSMKIGGTTVAKRNVISGNGAFGIYFYGGGSTNGTVQGNYIGVGANGTTALGNNSFGIGYYNTDGSGLIGGATGVTVNGACTGACNIIANNTSAGVGFFWTGPAGRNVRISSNSIHSNGGIGIDLEGGSSSPPWALDGVTPNDAGDADPPSAPNALQNYPVLGSAVLTGLNTVVSGTLNSIANATFTIEFFANTTADPSGYGEGERYLGNTTVTTDASGNASFSASLPTVASGTFITSTATDASNNTSEFSAAVSASLVRSLSGKVFEDVNYSGTTRGFDAAQGMAGINGATVELRNSLNAIVATTTTVSDGDYSFANIPVGIYTVRLDVSTVKSTRPHNGAGTELGVITYRSDTALATTAGATAAQTVTVAASDLADVNFGFNFDTVSNTNNDGAGSLRQFIINANLLGGDAALQQAGLPAGKENAILKLATTDPNYSGGVWTITLNSSLPNIDQPLILDGSKQATFNSSTAVPVIELNGNGGTGNGLTLVTGSSGSQIRSLGITNFSGDGINVQGNTGNNSILGNSIHSNGELGIDLVGGTETSGVTENDIGDGDSGPNSLLNYPEFKTLGITNGSKIITYEFDLDVATGTYRMEFFKNGTADASGHGEGQIYLGGRNITVTTSGNQNYKGAFNANQVLNGTDKLAVTLTRMEGTEFRETSEFSGTVTGSTTTVCEEWVNDPSLPPANLVIDENSTIVAFITAKDASGNTITYALKGVDGKYFTITASGSSTTDCQTIQLVNPNIVITKSAPADAETRAIVPPGYLPAPGNYEVPMDSDKDNVYQFQITATYANGQQYTRDVGIQIMDVNEAPIITSAAAVSFNEDTSANVLDIISQDPDAGTAEGSGLTYSITGGTDANQFEVAPATGILRFRGIPDYDAPTDTNRDNLYEVEVTVTDDGGLSGKKTFTVAVVNNSADDGVVLNVRALLQGAYDGASGLMSDALNAQGLLPTQQPYKAAPFNYAGAETLSAMVQEATDNNAVVDWVLVDLRSSLGTITATRAVMVQRDGDLVDAQTGSPDLHFANTPAGNYYVSVRHRNHLGIVSASPISLDHSVKLLNLASSSTPAKGEGSRLVIDKVAMMWAGDLNASNTLTANGPGNDVTTLLGNVITDVENQQANTNFIIRGYLLSDLNMDGKTLSSGPNNDASLLVGNIILHPLNTDFAANFIVRGGLSQ